VWYTLANLMERLSSRDRLFRGKDWYSSHDMSWVLHISQRDGVYYFHVAHPCATSTYRVHKPTGNKPDIERWDRYGLLRFALAPNTLDSGNTIWGASQVTFCDALVETSQ